MAYVPVPKDLSKVRTKIIFNLTLRQIICFVLAAVVGFPFYFLTKGTIGVDVAATIMIVLMLPFFLLALYEKDGQPLEKIIINYIRTKQNPKVRPYVTENMYQYLKDEGKRERGRQLEAKRENQTKKRKKVKPKG